MTGRASMRLEDCVAAIIDYRGRSPRKTNHGVPLITAKIVKNGRIAEPTEFIDPNEYDEWMRRGLPAAGDVLLTTEAPLGEVAQLRDARVALAQRLILLRGEPGVLDNTYLKYLLMSMPIQAQLLSRSSGTTVVGIRQRELRQIRLELPPIDKQQAIAAVLSSLDDKIEQNRRTARVLERLARAIFKAWFVDFEPVKAKAAGAASFPSMPQPTFDALPTAFTTTDHGPVPEGWEVGVVQDIATLSKAQVKPQEHAAEEFDHYSIPAFDAGLQPVTEPGESIKSGKFVVVPGCVLVSKLNPRIPRVWLPDEPCGQRQIASTEFLVLTPQDGWDRSYLYCQFTDAVFQGDLSQSASGTSNSHQRVRPGDFMAKTVVVPPSPLRRAFRELVVPIMDHIAAGRRETSALAALRDLLLPKLLSHEVRVAADAEVAV